MKIFKNLFGNGSKIDANEISVTKDRLLGQSVILESGSDTDGNFVKWSDGTMECYGFLEIAETPNITRGTIFVSNSFTVSFPREFKSVPVISLSTTYTGRWVDLTRTPSANSFSVCLMSATTSNDKGYVFYRAIGKWK